MDEQMKEVSTLMEEYKQEEAKINTLRKNQQTFFMQLQENSMVKEELDRLEDEAEIFKAVGPVLVKMELSDAKASVKQRMDRFSDELNKVQNNMKACGEKQEKYKQKIMAAQKAMQGQQQQQQGQ